MSCTVRTAIGLAEETSVWNAGVVVVATAGLAGRSKIPLREAHGRTGPASVAGLIGNRGLTLAQRQGSRRRWCWLRRFERLLGRRAVRGFGSAAAFQTTGEAAVAVGRLWAGRLVVMIGSLLRVVVVAVVAELRILP